MKAIGYLMFKTFLFFFLLAWEVAALAETLPPPEYQIMDPNHVNMATGQVSPTLTDLSIGGERGLTHSISTDGSEFVNYEQSHWGPRDSFNGGLRSIKLPKRYAIDIGVNDLTLPTDESRRILTSYLGKSSTDFYINGDGTYTARSTDPRHTLIYDGGAEAFIHTHPDGTQIYFESGHPAISSQHFTAYYHQKVEKVVHPNGFTLYFDYKYSDSVTSIRTNTGYQLKYIYDVKSLGLAPHLEANRQRIIDGIGYFYAEVNHSTWTTQTPSSIVALNNTHEFCPPKALTCAVTETWPRVKYTWPNGMPAAMYLGSGEFKVTDAEGGETVFYHSIFDKSTGRYGDLPAGYHFIPRLTAIKWADQTAPSITYKYFNEGELMCDSDFGLCYERWNTTDEGILLKARRGNHEDSYDLRIVTPYFYGNASSVYRGVGMVFKTKDPLRIYEVQAWNKKVYLERESSNRVVRIRSLSDRTNTHFEYDNRHNLARKILESPTGDSSIIVQKAKYPDTCNNIKTCNQAIWIEDAKGNRTDYTYHPQSGQVATITQPAPQPGMPRPQTRYKYEAKYAHFKNGSGEIERAETPLWLLTEESYCIHGGPASSGEGCALGRSDEVKTYYEYDDAPSGSNLHLKGVVIEAMNAAGEPETRRTCYAYDRYGNRISETLPKANLSACP